MKSKKLTNKELLAVVEKRLTELRSGFIDPQQLINPQEREMAQWRLGQITMLDEFRMLLTGTRRTFI